MKSYYQTRGDNGIPASMCSGIPGDPAIYAPKDSKRHRWVRVEDLRALLQAIKPFTVDGGVGCGSEEADALVEAYDELAQVVGTDPTTRLSEGTGER